MRRAALGLFTVAAATAVAGCFARTGLLVDAFNGGALDSPFDVSRSPDGVREDLAARTVKDDAIGAYFAQGKAPKYLHAVSKWLDLAAADAARKDGAFATFVQTLRDADRGTPAVAVDANDAADGGVCASQTATEKQVTTQKVRAKNDFIDTLRRWTDGGDPHDAPCDGKRPRLAFVAYHADRTRFMLSMIRAAEDIARFEEEGLVDTKARTTGVPLGLREASAYLANRRWTRSLERPVTGLVVKGGASTGFYSAGASWVVLNLIDHCLRDEACSKASHDPRLLVLSGTSTGAAVTANVDLFNAAWEGKSAENPPPGARTHALEALASWFTCFTESQMYCIRSGPLEGLTQTQRGLVEFDGVRHVMHDALSGAGLREDASELILNTVDFRSGQLLSLSDQDPSQVACDDDIVRAVEASFVLPFIAKPVDGVRIHGRLAPGVYLDGGIRSEIPLMPLARRGVERALVISSAASVLSGTPTQESALDIAARYIDVSTGNVAETELDRANRYAESTLAEEILRCEAMMKTDGWCKNPADHCEPEALCEGRWDTACDPAVDKPPSLPASKPPISNLFAVKGLYRDENRVEPSNGYTFERHELERLFLEGVDAARLRCLELATFLRIAAPNADLQRWCRETPTYDATLCTNSGASAARSCSNPILTTLDTCEGKTP